jgi:hypothetical protein
MVSARINQHSLPTFTCYKMFGEVLEPLLAFLAADRPFAEVSHLSVVSKTWRRVSLNALKTAHQLNLSGFAGSVNDGVV